MAGEPTVAMLTDFGLEDAYVGVMKSVILTRLPECSIIDLCHSLAPQNVKGAAYLAWTAYKYLPERAVLLCVVDPGVGTERRGIAVRWPGGYFIGPDNGWLSYIVRDALGAEIEGHSAPIPAGWRVVHLTKDNLWLKPVSSTFHGRDIFAPVTAALAGGEPVDDLGEPCQDLVAFPTEPTVLADGSVCGEVIHIDHFGNLITDIPAPWLPERFAVKIAGGTVSGPFTSYQADSPLVALVGSSGMLEIASPNSSAAHLVGVTIGADAIVRSAPDDAGDQ
jgi:S-adenosyl-L-methionine hydrolase (adenosine-forming)